MFKDSSDVILLVTSGVVMVVDANVVANDSELENVPLTELVPAIIDAIVASARELELIVSDFGEEFEVVMPFAAVSVVRVLSGKG